MIEDTSMIPMVKIHQQILILPVGSCLVTLQGEVAGTWFLVHLRIGLCSLAATVDGSFVEKKGCPVGEVRFLRQLPM